MIIIGLGANLPHPEHGAPARTLEAALGELAERGVRTRDRSRWFATPPWPASLSGQPWYVNGAAALETDLGPDALLRTLHEVEWSFGRVRTARWAPRRIDLDLIAYNGVTAPFSGRHGVAALPHPRLAERAFVLLPLKDIAPDWRHPATGAHIDDMIAAADRCGVEPLDGKSEKHLASGAAGS